MKIKSILLALIPIMLVYLNSCKDGQKEIVIPKSKIQDAINKDFPINEDVVVSSITIDTPLVYFADTNVGLKSKYNGYFLKKDVSGIVDFNGQVTYNEDEGAFYLSNFNLVNFTVNDADLSNQEELRSLIETVINKYLGHYPIYKLDPSKYKEKLAGMLIKDVKVEDDKLILLLGLW
jgi:hypothetical protein